MVYGNETLSDEDRAQLAWLHGTSLSTAMFSRLGLSVLKSYYRFVETSDREMLFVFREQGAVTAAAVLTWEGGSTLRRFVYRHPVVFSLRVAISVLTDGSFRGQLLAYLGEVFSRKQTVETFPEVLQVFAEPLQRGRGLGAKLMRLAESYVAQRGQDTIIVRTLAHGNEPALRFYQRLGYDPFRRAVFCGEEYVCFRKATVDQSV